MEKPQNEKDLIFTTAKELLIKGLDLPLSIGKFGKTGKAAAEDLGESFKALTTKIAEAYASIKS